MGDRVRAGQGEAAAPGEGAGWPPGGLQSVLAGPEAPMTLFAYGSEDTFCKEEASGAPALMKGLITA